MLVTEVVRMNLMTLNLIRMWIRTPRMTTIHRFHRPQMLARTAATQILMAMAMLQLIIRAPSQHLPLVFGIALQVITHQMWILNTDKTAIRLPQFYSYTFIPLAFETLGPINDSGTAFITWDTT